MWDRTNPYRPFCSERCKMIDLGAWATESYRIPVEEDNDNAVSPGAGAPDSGDATGRIGVGRRRRDV